VNHSSTASPQKSSIMTFAVGNQSFAVDLLKLREIVVVSHISNIPGKHKNVLGVMNVRNSNIPIIDLGLALGIRPDQNANGLVLVTEYYGSTQGFRVDSVGDIKTLNDRDFIPPSVKLSKIISYAQVEGSLFGMVDLPSVLHDIQG
jgi:chemotaxis signal transduction protein